MSPGREDAASLPVTPSAHARTSDVAATVLLSHRACTQCGAPYRNDFARCPVDGAEIADLAEDPLIGATVAHYTIEGLLGEGGMGRVYRAHHARLSHRRVALKVMHGELAATLATRLRFTQEAEAASQLDHPNVVSVIDFGRTSDGLMYLAMELVPGRPLSALIDEGPLAPDRAIALVRQVCAGLAHAHARGFVHRDLKPDNVMVVESEAGELARIVDFGLAVAADPGSDAPRVTTVGLALGTPAYAAPEQVNGSPVDHRADLFALGVTMFEMLAGVPPIVGTVRELIEQYARGAVPSIAERAPGVVVHPALEALVRSLMAPAPAARPASANAVLAALDAMAEPPRITATETDAPRGRRRRAWVGLAGALLGGIALAGWIVAPGDHVPLSALVSPRLALINDAPRPPSVPAPSVPAPIVEARVASPDLEPVDRPAYRERPTPVAKASVARTAAPRREPSIATAAPRQEPSPPVEVREEPEPAAPVAPVLEPVADVVVTAPPPPVPRPPPPAPAPIATRASVKLGAIEVTGSLTAGTVKRAIERALPSAAGCYGEAARRAAQSPSVDLSVQLTIDEHRSARGVRVAAPALPGMTACVAEAMKSVRTDSAPDVGTVAVSFTMRLTPVGP